MLLDNDDTGAGAAGPGLELLRRSSGEEWESRCSSGVGGCA